MAFYRKKGTQELTPWYPSFNMTGVSVSDSDIKDGSPKLGDMIAFNSKDRTDKWLVAEKFFNDNYELANF